MKFNILNHHHQQPLLLQDSHKEIIGALPSIAMCIQKAHHLLFHHLLFRYQLQPP